MSIWRSTNQAAIEINGVYTARAPYLSTLADSNNEAAIFFLFYIKMSINTNMPLVVDEETRTDVLDYFPAVTNKSEYRVSQRSITNRHHH